jgi:hypothetical protein
MAGFRPLKAREKAENALPVRPYIADFMGLFPPPAIISLTTAAGVE